MSRKDESDSACTELLAWRILSLSMLSITAVLFYCDLTLSAILAKFLSTIDNVGHQALLSYVLTVSKFDLYILGFITVCGLIWGLRKTNHKEKVSYMIYCALVICMSNLLIIYMFYLFYINKASITIAPVK